MSPSATFSSAAGSYLARTRKVLNLTLDQVAQAGRLYGAPWTATSVRNIEIGQASLTLPTLLVLALALGHIQGRPISLTDLFGHADTLQLTEGENGIAVSHDWLVNVLGKERLTYDLNPDQSFSTVPVDGESLKARVRRLELERNKYRVSGREIPKELEEAFFIALTDAQRERPTPPTLAEERAARKLSISPSDVQRYAERLWGRPLEEESAARAGEGSTPQARGRVTRILVEEIMKADQGDGPTT
ncbi:MAG: helix-turn-helix domain-containing protein [Leucobacter sp.]